MQRHVEPAESTCLTDGLLAELIDGLLGPEALASVHRHATGCSACRELLVTIARGGLGSGAGDATPEMSLEAPRTTGWTPPAEFDEFRLERLLGRGAMGVVYLAHDRSLDRQVALKFVATGQPGARARERFQNEARAIARLQHPNVVTVFRVGEVQGHPYIVSEYMVGQSLDQLTLPLPWRRALALGIGLARGLAAAHRQGVLHRDLKLSNAFLNTEGEVKLLDFGLAEFVDAGASVGPTGTRSIAGTPRYMAPELFRGGSATPRSDLYSLGLVLHELCTGTLPQPAQGVPLPPVGRPAPEALEPAEQWSGVPLTARVPGIDPDFAALIEHCLRADPGERIASAEVVRLGLERLHTPEVLSAENPYRGLATFGAEHRALFFGRDADIRAVLERLRYQSLVLVAGDSGVGKSSLCRAGILPRVVQGTLDEFRDFAALTLTPGRRPLDVLAAVLAPLIGQTEAALGARLAEAPGELARALREAHQQKRGVLLFVDQIEELLTLSEPVQAAHFSRLLGELALPSEGVRVLLTVRGDFLTRLGALPELGDEIERALYLLRPLTPEGVRDAIVGPARKHGIVFESEALVQSLVEATAQGSGSLPLLQFALAELWERRDPVRGCITQSALDEMGGVAGALSRHADGVLARLSRGEQQAARSLLGRLMTEKGTRARLSEEELAADSAEARATLQALLKGRLLHARTTGGTTSYEIAHEALIASWGTLRNWIDEDAGQRALRQRVEAAGAEWERLGRAGELLWRGRQLDEARALDEAPLGERERSFLRASRRAVGRQHLRRSLAVLLLLLVAAVPYGGLRLHERLKVQRFVGTRVASAQVALARGRAWGQRASTSREEALRQFQGREPTGPEVSPDLADPEGGAEETWSQSLDAFQQAEEAYAEAERAVDDALMRVHDHPEARSLLVELTHERLLLAERFHRAEQRDPLARRFERLAATDEAWRDRLKVPARLEIVTEPPGASVELTRYGEEKGMRRREPVLGVGPLGPTPLSSLSLPAGSYHLRFTRRGHAPVDLPLLLERGQYQRLHLVLPTSVPEGFVYVPPGCFIEGSGETEDVRKFLQSAPLHRRCLPEGYFIGRSEVTMGDWMAYLDTLPAGAPERRILEAPASSGIRALTLRQGPDGTWSFSLSLESGGVLRARAGEPLRYPGRSRRQEQDWRRFPLAGVSAEDLKGFLAWLDRSGRLPGARLCSEAEWSRAARGGDDRRYPHGQRLRRDDANVDVTYGRRPDAYGPDEVGAHPASTSPFGLVDMSGNAFEMTRPLTQDLGDIVLRGGGWYYDPVGALIATRQASNSKSRDPLVGVRVCASLPAR